MTLSDLCSHIIGLLAAVIVSIRAMIVFMPTYDDFSIVGAIAIIAVAGIVYGLVNLCIHPVIKLILRISNIDDV
jgi:uncharacterized membrane protein YvlD (DUF360 family)